MHVLGFHCLLPVPLPPLLFHVQWTLLSVSLPLSLYFFLPIVPHVTDCHSLHKAVWLGA